MSEWVAVCRLNEIVPNTGVCALVNERQVAVFRLDDDSVYAIENHDPFSRANVLSRGIVGDLKGELVVASPVYKQHFSLASGECLEDTERARAGVPGAAGRRHGLDRERERLSMLSGQPRKNPTRLDDNRVSSSFLKAGHWPTLAAAFLYFDASFMVWVMLGRSACRSRTTSGSTPRKKD